jgi:hypothetical protein
VDALVVGYYGKKCLVAAGKVRAGLTPLVRRTLAATLARRNVIVVDLGSRGLASLPLRITVSAAMDAHR